tara:strand:- start:1962 stop:2906 length:945 start_codon:yes stop_codon:yes gene_type:complete
MPRLSNVMNLFGLRQKAGEVGIEIEVEGENLIPSPEGWAHVRDGSLRGNSMEYLLERPIKREDTKKYLNRLGKAFKQGGFKLKKSDRTSVHVHLNVQKFNMIQVVNTVCIYYILEELMIGFCGENRTGNLFCLSSKDAEYPLLVLPNIIEEERWPHLKNNTFKYASINLKAIPTYGSLEFRAMKGTVDFKLIETWIKMLLKIKDAAEKYGCSADIVENLSMNGSEQFLHNIMEEYAPLLFTRGMEDSIMDGVRRVQHVAYTKKNKERFDPYEKIERKMRKEGIIPAPRRPRGAPPMPQWEPADIDFEMDDDDDE